MCLFDQRLANFTQFKSLNVNTTAGSVGLCPDLSRATLVWAMGGGVAYPLVRGTNLSPSNVLPTDLRYGLPPAPGGAPHLGGVYSRETLGPFVRGPLWIWDVDGVGIITLNWYEMDNHYYSLINQLTG